MRAILVLSIALVSIAALVRAASQDYASAPNRPAERPASWVEGQGKEITIKGEQVCLKRRNEGFRRSMSCAIGFRGDDEKYYGLRDSDPHYRNTASGGTRKKITGTLWPSLGGEYVEEGTIEVREAVAIDDDPKVLVGEYACMPWGAQQAGSQDDCTPGIKSRGAYHWAFYPLSADGRAMLSKLKVGDAIEVSGPVTTHADEEEWFRLWRNHPVIEGAVQVASVKRVSGQRGP